MTRNDWTGDEEKPEPELSRRTEAEIAKELRLRTDPPMVMRVSRKAIAIAVGVAAAGFGAAFLLGLEPRTQDTAQDELYSTGRATPAVGMASLPRDYTGVPKLGPPLPGEFGKPVLRRAQESGESIPAGPYSAGVAPAPRTARPTPEAQARLEARSSGLFIGSRSSASSSPLPVGERNDGDPPDTPVAKPESSRRAFVSLGEAADPRKAIAFDHVLQAGTIIPAALVTGIQSDLPGLVIAQVTEPVRDSLSGTRVLIPQGARLIGTYDSELAAGQTRLLLAWTRLLMPDGRAIDLDRMPAADPTGQAGLSDRVDIHWSGTAKAALISTILSIGAQSGQTGNESDIARAIRDGASDSVARTGRQIVEREIERRPTITIRPGVPIRVIVSSQLAFES